MNTCTQYSTVLLQITKASWKVNEPEYHVNVAPQRGRGECTYTVGVYGKGIVDSFPFLCQGNQNQESSEITSPKYLLYEGVDMRLFSDERSTLMIILPEKCYKRKYATPYTTTYSYDTTLSPQECDKLRDKVDKVEQDQDCYEEDNEKPIEVVTGDNEKEKNGGGILSAIGSAAYNLLSYWYS